MCSQYAHQEALGGAQVLLDVFMWQFQQYTMLEGMYEAMVAKNAALEADKAKVTGNLEGLRRGFLRVCQRLEGAMKETQAAKTRLAEKEKEVTVLRVEKEEHYRRCRFVFNAHLPNCCL